MSSHPVPVHLAPLPDWRNDARCVHDPYMTPAKFYGGTFTVERVELLRAYCGACPVRETCLAEGNREDRERGGPGHVFGFRAGHTEEERKVMVRALPFRARSCSGCGVRFVPRKHDQEYHDKPCQKRAKATAEAVNARAGNRIYAEAVGR